MWKVMVVDDEPKIRRGLCRFIENSELPLILCGQASDGISAAKLALETEPDIILLDICMPKMDGLEFLSLLRKNSINAKTILITGFDEFSFAQTSISLKAFAYLLKPIDDNTLHNHLEKAIHELEAEQAETKQKKQALYQLEKNSVLLKQIFGRDWANGRLSQSQIEEQINFWGYELENGFYLTVVSPNLKPLHQITSKEKELMLFAVDNMAAETLEKFNIFFSFRDINSYSLMLSEKYPTAEICEQVNINTRQHLEIGCVVKSCPVKSPETLHEIYAQLKEDIEAEENANPLVDEVINYIDKNYGNPSLSLIDLSNALCISQSYICKVLKSKSKTSFVEYLTEKRVKEAMRLLSETDFKISLISQKVGFFNQHYFSSVFKKYTGVSPSVFREKNLGND